MISNSNNNSNSNNTNSNTNSNNTGNNNTGNNNTNNNNTGNNNTGNNNTGDDNTGNNGNNSTGNNTSNNNFVDKQKEDEDEDENEDEDEDFIDSDEEFEPQTFEEAFEEAFEEEEEILEILEKDSNNSPVIDFTSKIQISQNHHSNFYKKVFDEGYSINKKSGLINEMCKNPDIYYPEDVEEISYADVANYFREPILCLKKDGTLIKTGGDQSKGEVYCKANNYCWTFRNFQIVLREFKDFKF
ncbi:unnamed protein product, partial [marine sediment metagenome]